MFEADDWSSLSCYLHFPSTSFKTCTFVLKKYEKSVKEREEGVGEEEVREINSDRLSFVVFSVFGVEKVIFFLFFLISCHLFFLFCVCSDNLCRE